MRFREKKQRHKKELNNNPQWLGLSMILQNSKLLPYVMVTGPRWNCHANIMMLSNVAVTEKIVIDVSAANSSAREWTCIIYDEHYKVINFYNSWQNVEYIELKLSPGKYRINMRYYHCETECVLPSVIVDEKELVPETDLSQEAENYQEYLSRIKNYKSPYYKLLQYYIFNVMKWRCVLPESLVRDAFLPVGNPGTQFFYGVAKQNQIIQLTLNESFFALACIYITYYNRCSFPVFWQEITELNYQSRSLDCDGFYLIRIHPKKSAIDELDLEKIKCEVS